MDSDVKITPSRTAAAKALFGSALRVVDTQSGNKTKSVSVEIGSTTRSTFVNNPSSPPTLILADPQKRLLSAWPIANVAKQPPSKFGLLPAPISEGVTSELVNVVHHPDPNGRDGGWVVMTELIQWPLLKSLNPQFKAGSIRAVKWGDRDGTNGVKDFWGYAATFVDVPVRGQWTRLFCYADRPDPKSPMRLHFQDLSPPVPQPHERHPTQPYFLSFDVEIPTYDGSDVPKFVHHVPGRAVIVLTASGIMHAFTLEGSLIGSSRMQHMPPSGADLLCYSSAGGRPGELGEGFYINVGPIVVRIRLDVS
ncbi:hypothetical protein FRC05_009966 [Tulasnella sp. 425]|nr:hypothetical protein FRC05_009966 [Tulasnella sp. 425]